MIRLDRSRVKVLARWREHVERVFPDFTAFEERANTFEALDLDDPVRRKGFKSFAPGVLPRKRGGCDFKAIWGKAKKALAAMSYQKCSYCESPINAERSAAVEHFKPKSLFPLLCCEWSNYFLGCGGCNSAKADKWPKGGGRYVRPDEDDPSALFVFREDGTIEAASPGGDAEHTIRDLDLNRDWLCRLRARVTREMLDDAADILSEQGIPEDVRERLIRKAFSRLQNPEIAYSESLRQCVRRVWRKKFPGFSL